MYYAKQSPRGFANEIVVHQFPSRRERDAWVEQHETDGDCNSAARGARSCSASEAHRLLRRVGQPDQYIRLEDEHGEVRI